jgi:hypothetical protein
MGTGRPVARLTNPALVPGAVWTIDGSSCLCYGRIGENTLPKFVLGDNFQMDRPHGS